MGDRASGIQIVREASDERPPCLANRESARIFANLESTKPCSVIPVNMSVVETAEKVLGDGSGLGDGEGRGKSRNTELYQ